MAEIPNYPPPVGPLDGSELLLGFAGGVTRRITSAEVLAYMLASPDFNDALETYVAGVVDQVLSGERLFTLTDTATGAVTTGYLRPNAGVLTIVPA